MNTPEKPSFPSESVESFRKSFFYGSRSDLSFKFIADLNDSDCTGFLQNLFRDIVDALDDRDMDRLRFEIEMNEEDIKRKKARSVNIDGFFNRIFKAFADAVSQENRKSPGKFAPFVGLIFIVYFFYQIITDFYFFRLLFRSSITYWNSYVLIYVLTMIAILIGATGIILKKKSGWIILNVVGTKLFLWELFSMFHSYRLSVAYKEYEIDYIPDYERHFLFLAIFFIPLYYCNRKPVREIFAANKTEQWLSIIPIAFITFLMWYHELFDKMIY